MIVIRRKVIYKYGLGQKLGFLVKLAQFISNNNFFFSTLFPHGLSKKIDRLLHQFIFLTNFRSAFLNGT